MIGDVKVAVCTNVQEIVMLLALVHVMPVVLVLLIKSTTAQSVIIHVVKLVKENVLAVKGVVQRLVKAVAQVHVRILVCLIVPVIALLHVLGHVFIPVQILVKELVRVPVMSGVFILIFIERNLSFSYGIRYINN